MINWKTKLTSRKFWLAVTEFVTMMMTAFKFADTTITQVAAIIMAGAGLVAYIIAEGFTDAKAAKATIALPFTPDEGADV